MRDHYDIKNLNPRRNPYVKKQITINLDENIVLYFKNKSNDTGIPYQNLINLYLRDCVNNKRNIKIAWK